MVTMRPGSNWSSVPSIGGFGAGALLSMINVSWIDHVPAMSISTLPAPAGIDAGISGLLGPPPPPLHAAASSKRPAHRLFDFLLNKFEAPRPNLQSEYIALLNEHIAPNRNLYVRFQRVEGGQRDRTTRSLRPGTVGS